MVSDPGATTRFLERLYLSDNNRLRAVPHRGRCREIEARCNSPQIGHNLRSQIQFRRTSAGYIRQSQAEQIMSSIATALDITAGYERMDEVVRSALGDMQLSTQLRKRQALL